MTTQPQRQSGDVAAAFVPRAASGRRTIAAADAIALGLLLACLCARVFIGEVPYRTSAAAHPEALLVAGQDAAQEIVERAELARVTFSALMLAAAVVWLGGRAAAGSLTIRHGWLGVLMLAFAAWSLAAALNASDERSALDSWIEQCAMLAACFVTAQLCKDRRRFGLVVVVLAALGFTMAVKGLWQIKVEVPARIEEFQANRAKYLAQRGIQPGAAEEKMFETRVLDHSPTGFGPLANLFASLMIVLAGAAAGVAAQKLITAGRLRKQWRPHGRGEVHTPTLAGILTALGAAAAAAVLILTRSRGGIIAAGAATAAAVIVYCRRGGLARRRTVLLAAAAVVILAAAAAVIAYGRKHDRLPTKTMTFRWFYWTATAEMVRDNPMLGVGPGNFADAYLRYRRLPGGEEAVKAPHNAVVHAAAQYGLPGAAAYVAMLIGVLVCATAPGRQEDFQGRPNPTTGWAWLVMLLAGSAFASRALFTEAGLGAPVLLLDAALPAAVLAGFLYLARWAGAGSDDSATSGPAARIILLCAAAGFVLHNMVTFSLWAPAAATAFWIAAGACMGRAAGAKERSLSKLRWPLAAAALAGLLAAAAVLWYPVWRRTMLTENYLAALPAAPQQAVNYAVRAAKADGRDPLSAADAARALRLFAHLGPKANACPRVTQGLHWAKEAMRRDPQDAAHARLAAALEYERAKLAESDAPPTDKALGLAGRAVELDPQNARQRIDYARMLLEAGKPAECLRRLREAESIDASLFPDSDLRLDKAERQEIEELRKGIPSGAR